jgi:hypothetical protein
MAATERGVQDSGGGAEGVDDLEEEMTALEAMAQMEGFGVPGAIPTICNNPLDLIYCDEAIHFGAIGNYKGFAKFASVDDPQTGGMQAARRWLSVPAHFDADGNLIGGYMGATLKQVINRFCPGSQKGNSPLEYLAFVCEKTGLTPATVLTPALLG